MTIYSPTIPENVLSSSSPTIQTTPIVKKPLVKKEPIKKKTNKTMQKTNMEVPIFLRKTYHMIDTCDPTIASWSDNGETFVVKQPQVFETRIIPQFFKHNKFSSFVRQLNFYGFRKIKFSDTIKIDVQMEKETANFWRFRHENFLRGKPELLGEIRRSNNHNNNGNTTEKKVKATTVKAEGAAGGTEEDVSELKTEVSFLKEKLAKMTSNIDQLTSLVEKISMNERPIKEEGPSIIKTEEELMVGNKRKKLVPPSLIVPDSVVSSNPAVQLEDRMEDVEYSTISMLTPPTRQESESSDISDDAFVDELLNSFQDDNDDELDLLPDPILSDDELMLTDTLLEKDNATQQSTQNNSNVPDPKLMNELSGALTVLPKDIQEMLVNKLIGTITSSDVLKSHLDAVTSSSSSDNTDDKKENMPIPTADKPDVTIPLAAATMSAILSQYSDLMKSKTCVDKKTKSNMTKSVPMNISICT